MERNIVPNDFWGSSLVLHLGLWVGVKGNSVGWIRSLGISEWEGTDPLCFQDAKAFDLLPLSGNNYKKTFYII